MLLSSAQIFQPIMLPKSSLYALGLTALLEYIRIPHCVSDCSIRVSRSYFREV